MGTVHALARLREVCAGETAATKARLLEVLDHVAAQLGNTRSVTRKFYVHPGLQQEYLDGRLAARLAKLGAPPAVRGLSADESALLALLATL